MEYGKIIAVTGMPGLYELLSSKNDGAIVRSLEDKSTKFVSSRVHNFSHLESIEVFTVRDNVNLTEIFHAMENGDGKAPDTKNAGELKKYFEKVFPDLDFERVYSSDLKKMVKWFVVLKENEVEIKLTPRPEEEEEPVEEVAAAEPKEEKKTTAKKAEPAKTEDKAPAEEPKKKAAKKPAAVAKEAASTDGEPVEEKSPAAGAKDAAPKKAAKKAAPKKKSEE